MSIFIRVFNFKMLKDRFLCLWAPIYFQFIFCTGDCRIKDVMGDTFFYFICDNDFYRVIL